MCGLAGILGTTPLPAEAGRMTDALRHRGPDDRGTATLRAADGPAGEVGHTRLAVLDPTSAGRQPFRSEDGRWTLIYNGEIYNFRELRDELRRGGHRFRSDTDTEVLLRGWIEHGPAFLERLRGMFAFAIWDAGQGRGVLARDPFGIKPLYYAVPGPVVFASEVRAILASGLVPPRLSATGLRSYLAAGSVQEPLTLIEGVRMLPAGTRLDIEWRDGRPVPGDPVAYGPDPLMVGDDPIRDRAAAARAVRDALRDSVAAHLVSDVPLGFMLSGGIDSSAVVAVASEVSDQALDTFNVTFGEAGGEAEHARAVAGRFGTSHHEILLEGGHALGLLPDAFAAMDQPSQDGLNTYVVSRAIRQAGIKVALSGLGADELCGGYPAFDRARRVRPVIAVPLPLRRLAARGAGRLGGIRGGKLRSVLEEASVARGAYAGSRLFLDDGTVRALTGDGRPLTMPVAPAGLSTLREVAWYEVNGYMRNTLLRDSDVFSSAHGLELRVPFVDRHFAGVAGRIDDRLVLDPDMPKPALVRAVADLLPRQVWDRPKQGFVLPLDRWLRDELRGEVEAAFSDGALEQVGLAPGPAREIWHRFLDRRGGMNYSRPWALFTLARWAREHGVAAVTTEWPLESRGNHGAPLRGGGDPDLES